MRSRCNGRRFSLRRWRPGRDATLEFDGVELAAIQGLHRGSKQKDAEIAELRARLGRLEQMLTK